MRFSRLMVLLLATMLLAGCVGGSVGPKRRTATSDAVVSMNIDWNRFETLEGVRLLSASSVPLVTHVGVRIVYHDENAAFSQSTARQPGEPVGIVTLAVPPTKRADIYVAAVQHESSPLGTGTTEVVWLGARRDVVIESQSVLSITIDDVDWTKPNWDFVEQANRNGYATANELVATAPDVFEVDGELVYAYDIFVTDPFQIGVHPSDYDAMIIGLSGTGYLRENTNGLRRMTFWCNQGNDAAKSTDCYGHPYLRGSMFNLPGSPGRYRIVNPLVGTGNITIRWE